MKSKLNSIEVPAIKTYPYLGVWQEGNIKFVVWFIYSQTGFVVYEENSMHSLGDNGEIWDEKEFNVLKGDVILSN